MSLHWWKWTSCCPFCLKIHILRASTGFSMAYLMHSLFSSSIINRLATCHYRFHAIQPIPHWIFKAWFWWTFQSEDYRLDRETFLLDCIFHVLFVLIQRRIQRKGNHTTIIFINSPDKCELDSLVKLIEFLQGLHWHTVPSTQFTIQWDDSLSIKDSNRLFCLKMVCQS